MNKNNSLKQNFFYNLISQVLTLIVPIITTPYLARILQEKGNGQYSYTFSIITYFILFANLGFSVYGQRELSKYRDDLTLQKTSFFEIFFLRLIFTVISLAILFLLSFFIGFGSNYDLLIRIESLNVIAVIFDFTFFYQGNEDFKSIAFKNILVKTITIICVFLFVKEQSDVWAYALIIGLNTLFTNIIMIPRIIRFYHKIPICHLSIIRHLKPAILIFLPTLAVTIYSVFDKTMIGLLALNPDYENGCYEQAYKINSLILTLVVVISPIYIPRNAYDYSTGNFDALKNHMYFAANYVWFISVPLVVGMVLLSSNLCSWFLGEGYNEVPLLLKIMSLRFIVSGFGTLFGDMYFIPIGKEKYPTVATFFAAGLNVVLNYFLIQKMGATGAAITTAVSEFAVTMILAFLIFKEHRLSIKKILFISWKYFFAAIVMAVPVYFLNKYMPFSALSFFIAVFVGGISYITFLLLIHDQFVLSIIKQAFVFIKQLRKEEN